MSRSINLTEKLGLAGKPTIVIGDTTLTVENSAENILRIFPLLEKADVTPKEAVDAASLLFDKASQKALKGLGLSFPDYMIVIQNALDLILDDGSAEGELPMQDTTS